MDDARVTCKDCGFEWFGETSAHALRTIGSCTRCRGELKFNNAVLPLPPMVEDLVNVPAHLVMGNPRF
jgi:hypothetical protein